VSRRASLPGAEELFRRTSGEKKGTAPRRSARESEETQRQDTKSTNLQVAEDASPDREIDVSRRGPKHDEKVTFYCTGEDLLALERARLRLRSEHGVAADRGRIVRAALGYVLEDFDARGDDSVLLRRLAD
jgi:hypothetical protein